VEINLIVFDFDGTLFDTKKDIAASVNAALIKYGFQPVDEETCWRYTGDGTEILLRRVLQNKNVSNFKEMLNYTIKYYSLNFANFTMPVDNVLAFIDKFREKKKVILSNKNLEIINKILDKFNLSDKFQAVYGKESFSKSKPDPYPILEIMKKFGTTRENTVYIGDSINDITLSKRAGIKSFIIPSGVTPIEEIKHLKPFKIFHDYKEIENLIK
jgi:phosphoglycolate phosphatase